MGTDPGVLTTVVIPVWGAYVPWLTNALASLRAQNAAMRVVVVDNASEVTVPDLDGVSIVRTPSRLTLGAARNAGLAAVSTPYVVFWDADDEMLAGTVSFLEAAIGSDPRLSAFGTAIVEMPSGRRHRWPRRWVAAVARLPAIFALLDCLWSLYPTTGATIMRSESVRSAGGYGDAESGEDWCLGVSLAFRGRIGWSERRGRIYRLHAQSTWSRSMTVRHLLRHAKAVRERIRRDPGIPGWAKTALPAVAAGQYATVLAHVGLSATRNLRQRVRTGRARRA